MDELARMLPHAQGEKGWDIYWDLENKVTRFKKILRDETART
jgi:hypothetical protein